VPRRCSSCRGTTGALRWQALLVLRCLCRCRQPSQHSCNSWQPRSTQPCSASCSLLYRCAHVASPSASECQLLTAVVRCSYGTSQSEHLVSWFPQVLLARYSAQDDIVVGTPYANRSMPELKQLAGCMVNTLALRTVVGDRASFQQLLKEASRAVREAFSHAEAPFSMVVDALKQPRSASFTPVYQVRSNACHAQAAWVPLAMMCCPTSRYCPRLQRHLARPGAADPGGRVDIW
jgi:Condensation domain